MTEQIIQHRGMKDFEMDSKWFYESINSFRKKNLVGNFVAIKDKNIIAYNKDVNLVVKAIEDKGENPAYILIEFIYPEGTVVLL